MPFSDDDMLMLSGIQHFVFCPRQWALIHIEQHWEENHLTIEGELQHMIVDDPSYRQKNGEKITLRGVSIASRKLGLYGLSDAIELIPSDDSENSITHRRYDGLWMPIPVEYKHGKRKPDNRDVVQVVAQAMCLEEMYGITIPYGVLYYWGENHREIVGITDEIRNFVSDCSKRMHQIFDSGITPPAEYKPHCRNCSLIDTCMPGLKHKKSVKSYLMTNLYEETP